MSIFLDTALSFPTVVFTFFLCLSTILWLLTALGFLGVDAGQAGDIGDIGDIGGDIGLFGTHAHAETDTISVQETMGFMSRFGLNGIPITIVISLTSLLGWVTTYSAQKWLLNQISVALFYYLAGLVVMLLAFFISVMITAKICAPLRRSLLESTAPSKAKLAGQTATVLTSLVNMQFGEARLNDDGADLLLKIRAEEKLGFKKGDKVVLLQYLPDQHAYLVISEAEFNGY